MALHFSVIFSVLTILFCFVSETHSSGYLELHLQSPYIQSLSVNITSNVSSEKSEVIRNIVLHPGFPYNVTRTPIQFDNRVYNITIDFGASKEEGLHEAHISSSFVPRLGILSPAAVARPLNGIRIIIRCDQNYHGEKCDVFCDSDAAKSKGKVCNSLGKVACPNGFTGPKCDKKITKCSCSKESGQCIDSGNSTSPICQCSISFRGERCELKQKSATMSSHYKGDFWNFKMTMWQLMFSNLVENQLAEMRPSSTWEEIKELLGKSNETPFRNRPVNVEAVIMDGIVDLTPSDES